MFFRKKKKTQAELELLAADMIEHTLTTGQYLIDNTASRWMCICIHQREAEGLITNWENREICQIILRRLGGCKTLAGYLYVNGMEVGLNDEFHHRIIMSNFWWRFIRELRKQPPLETSYA